MEPPKVENSTRRNPVPARQSTAKTETEIPPRENDLRLSLALIMDRLDKLERLSAKEFGDPELEHTPRARREIRQDYRRETIFTEGGTAVSPGMPKMEKPETFEGEYTVLYSVLNWLRAVCRYLKPHDIPTDMYPQYAYAYMGKNVKAWYDARFGEVEDPKWELFEQAIIERYLPGDHVIQVTKMYEGIVQTGSLADYVEEWQALMVAVRASGMNRTNQDHVIQFVTGLARVEDRKSILDQDPETLEDTYRAATRIRHYSLLAHDYS
jgi:hypothetical protein